MLPNSPQVLDVALGPNSIIEGARDGLVYVDMSSIAPPASRKVHDALTKRGVPMLDAPVSGGEPKAIDGTLSIMVGGDRALHDSVRDVLGVLGSAVVHVGDIGSGNTAKLANQVVVALNIAAVSEALTLAQMAQVDPQSVFQAIRGGLAGSTVLEVKAPMMLDRNFKPGLVLAPVNLTAAAVLGAGALLGSWLGPQVVRVVPERPLRVAIGLAGIGLAGIGLAGFLMTQ